MESGSLGAKFVLKILWLLGCECIGDQDDKSLFFAYVEEHEMVAGNNESHFWRAFALFNFYFSFLFN